jgi:prepilin-type processing-associated H-X9-DG protein
VLGWADAVTSGRLQGKASLIRQSSRTMFAADGLGGTLYSSRFPYNLGMGMSTLYNISPNPPVTMTDALLGDGNAGDPECFDTKRHHGKINVAFCDGHVETRNITPKDLSTIFLLAP